MWEVEVGLESGKGCSFAFLKTAEHSGTALVPVYHTPAPVEAGHFLSFGNAAEKIFPA
jgi:hypothetical protein